jgi:hypothetical protein
VSTAVAKRPAKKKPAKPARKPKPLLCTRRKQNGEPCKRHRKKGMDVCASHAGTAHRPSLFTDDVKHKIIEALKAGVWKKDAAVYAGIAPTTLDEWLARAAKYEELGEANELTEFSAAVRVTQVKHKVYLVGQVTKAAAEDWKAAMVLLERMFPNEYGRRDAKLIEHTGTVEIEALLGDRQPAQLPRGKRERIVAILDEDEGIEVLEAEDG